MTRAARIPEFEPGPGQGKPKLGVWQVLRRSLVLFVRHFGSLALLAFVPALVVTIIEYYLAPGELMQTGEFIFAYEASPSIPAYILFWIVDLTLSSLAAGFMVAHVANLRSGNDTGLGHSIKAAFQSAKPLIVCGSAASLAILAGIIAYIVPGLYLMVLWCVLIPSIVIEKSAYSCFRRSWQLTSGYRWACSGIVIISFLIDVLLYFGMTDPFRYLIFSSDASDRIAFLLLSTLYRGLAMVASMIPFTLIFFRLKDIKEGSLAQVFV